MDEIAAAVEQATHILKGYCDVSSVNLRTSRHDWLHRKMAGEHFVRIDTQKLMPALTLEKSANRPDGRRHLIAVRNQIGPTYETFGLTITRRIHASIYAANDLLASKSELSLSDSMASELRNLWIKILADSCVLSEFYRYAYLVQRSAGATRAMNYALKVPQAVPPTEEDKSAFEVLVNANKERLLAIVQTIIGRDAPSAATIAERITAYGNIEFPGLREFHETEGSLVHQDVWIPAKLADAARAKIDGRNTSNLTIGSENGANKGQDRRPVGTRFGRAAVAPVHSSAQKVGAGEVTTHVVDAPAAAEAIFSRVCSLYDKRGWTQVGDLLSLVGALGGFASQQAVWKACIEPEARNPGDFLVRVGTKSGECFYFGEAINVFLKVADGTHYSFYSMVGGAIPDLTRDKLPDLKEIFGYVAKSIGSPAFGLTRLPNPHGKFEAPRSALNRNWGWVQSYLQQFRNPPAHWPLILGSVAHRAIKGSQNVVERSLAARLVMESAIAMSKIDPVSVPGATSGLDLPETWSNRALTPAREPEILTDVYPLLPVRMPF